MEYYRLVFGLFYYHKQFPETLINSLVERFLSYSPGPFKDNFLDPRWTTYIGGASGIIGALKSTRYRLDNLLYARLQDLLSNYHDAKNSFRQQNEQKAQHKS